MDQESLKTGCLVACAIWIGIFILGTLYFTFGGVQSANENNKLAETILGNKLPKEFIVLGAKEVNEFKETKDKSVISVLLGYVDDQKQTIFLMKTKLMSEKQKKEYIDGLLSKNNPTNSKYTLISDGIITYKGHIFPKYEFNREQLFKKENAMIVFVDNDPDTIVIAYYSPPNTYDEFLITKIIEAIKWNQTELEVDIKVD